LITGIIFGDEHRSLSSSLCSLLHSPGTSSLFLAWEMFHTLNTIRVLSTKHCTGKGMLRHRKNGLTTESSVGGEQAKGHNHWSCIQWWTKSIICTFPAYNLFKLLHK
jgi:hypothetical protein